VLDEEEWFAALRDAEVEDLGVEVYACEATVDVDLPTAALFAPGNVLVGRQSRVLSARQLDQFKAHVDRHRILLDSSASPLALSAKLRHELEHVRQWQHGGDPLFHVYHASNDGTERYVGEDRRGSGVLYNIVPLEVDANAAASRFIRSRIDASLADQLSNSFDGILFRKQPPPEAVDTAGVRSVCFASLAAEEVEGWLEDHPLGARPLLDAVAGDANLWDRLRHDERLAHLNQQAEGLIPDTATLSALEPDFRPAWQPLRSALLSAYARALEIAGI
jgi:hypothetical protein